MQQLEFLLEPGSMTILVRLCQHCTGCLPSSSWWYSSRPRRSSTSCMTHRPPLPPGTGLSLPVAVGALLRPPELLRPRLNRHLGRCVEPLAGERHPRIQARPQVVQEVDEVALTRATWRCWISGDGKNSAAVPCLETLTWIHAQGSHYALPQPASTALGGGRSSLSVAVSHKSIAHIRGPHPELQKL